MLPTIAIVGAGLAGIAAARQLAPLADVTVFEKSRGPGGRMATRRAGDFQFDHGAQFFTARTESFRSLLAEQSLNSAVAIWEPKVINIESGKKTFKRPWYEDHYVAVPRMNLLVKTLAAEIEVILQTRVANIESAGSRWRLQDDQGAALGEFDWVISAAPAPQTQALMPREFSEYQRIASAEFSPCFSLMIGMTELDPPGFDCAVVRDSPIAWLALNHLKPQRPAPASVLVHSNNDWAAQHVDRDPDDVQRILSRALEELTGIDARRAAFIALHRWLYARVESTVADDDFLLDDEHQLASCGDWCVGNRVEDAFTSGTALGRTLREMLG